MAGHHLSLPTAPLPMIMDLHLQNISRRTKAVKPYRAV